MNAIDGAASVEIEIEVACGSPQPALKSQSDTMEDIEYTNEINPQNQNGKEINLFDQL